MHWKTLKVAHKAVKWLDKRLSFLGSVSLVSKPATFCARRSRTRANNKYFMDTEIRYDSTVSFWLKNRRRADVASLVTKESSYFYFPIPTRFLLQLFFFVERINIYNSFEKESLFRCYSTSKSKEKIIRSRQYLNTFKKPFNFIHSTLFFKLKIKKLKILKKKNSILHLVEKREIQFS